MFSPSSRWDDANASHNFRHVVNFIAGDKMADISLVAYRCTRGCSYRAWSESVAFEDGKVDTSTSSKMEDEEDGEEEEEGLPPADPLGHLQEHDELQDRDQHAERDHQEHECEGTAGGSGLEREVRRPVERRQRLEFRAPGGEQFERLVGRFAQRIDKSDRRIHRAAGCRASTDNRVDFIYK